MWEGMKRSGDFNVKLARRKTGYGTFSAEFGVGIHEQNDDELYFLYFFGIDSYMNYIHTVAN